MDECKPLAGGPLPAPAPRTADESPGANARRHFLAGSGDYHRDNRGGGRGLHSNNFKLTLSRFLKQKLTMHTAP